jgi:AraC-like DNA-binding protein
MSELESIARVVVRPDYRIEYSVGSTNRAASVELDLTAVVVLGGTLQACVGDDRRTIAADSLALIDAGCSATLDTGDGGAAEVMIVAVAPSIVDRVVDRLGLVGIGEIVFRHAYASQGQALATSSRRLAIEVTGRSAGRAEMLDSLVDVWTVDLLRAHARVDRTARLERSRAGIVDRRLRRAIEFIHDNHSRELATSEIAAAAYLSEFHFARLFKRVTGQTPHAYVAGVRLARARRLLAETDMPVSQVGERVGYQSASHFAKVFREVSGCTPTAYREAAGTRLNGPY